MRSPILSYNCNNVVASALVTIQISTCFLITLMVDRVDGILGTKLHLEKFLITEDPIPLVCAHTQLRLTKGKSTLKNYEKTKTFYEYIYSQTNNCLRTELFL